MKQLIDYIRKARAAGRGDAVTLALRILVFGYLDTIERRVALKVPRAGRRRGGRPRRWRAR